jgi:hypothetical protein
LGAFDSPAPSASVGSVVGYSLVIPESFVNWKGMNVMGGNKHQGYIKPLTGTLAGFTSSGRKPARQEHNHLLDEVYYV